MTNTVTDEQIEQLLDALNYYETGPQDHAVVRRWLEMINSAAEPTVNAAASWRCQRCGGMQPEHSRRVSAGTCSNPPL